MKLNVELDCTAEEARRMMGLPDLTPVHDRYIQMLTETMTGGVKPEMVEGLLRSWAPMGEAGLGLWRRMVEAAPTK